MSTTFAPLLSATASTPASTDVADVHLTACAAVVCVAGSADGRHLRGTATSRDTSSRVGVGAGEVVHVDLLHHP